jgi:hypothetical protein
MRLFFISTLLVLACAAHAQAQGGFTNGVIVRDGILLSVTDLDDGDGAYDKSLDTGKQIMVLLHATHPSRNAV